MTVFPPAVRHEGAGASEQILTDKATPRTSNSDMPPGDQTPNKKARWLLGIGITAAAAGVVTWALISGNLHSEQLPEGFPTQAELPLAPGKILEQAKLPGSQSTVTVQVADHAEQQEAVTKLEEQGYRLVGAQGSGPVGAVTSLANEDHAVRVEFGRDASGSHSVTYLTSPIPQQTDPSPE